MLKYHEHTRNVHQREIHFTLHTLDHMTFDLPGSSQSILQPLTGESWRVCTLREEMGTLDHWYGLSNWMSSRGGHCGWICFPPLNSTAESGSAFYKGKYQHYDSIGKIWLKIFYVTIPNNEEL